MPIASVAEPRAGSLASKTSWRSKTLKRPPLAPEVDEVEQAAPEISSNATDEIPRAGSDDDLVLEQDPDDGDVTNLIDKTEVSGEG
jgi:hypothetical protein